MREVMARQTVIRGTCQDAESDLERRLETF